MEDQSGYKKINITPYQLKPYSNIKNIDIPWLMMTPNHWEMLPNRALFYEVIDKNHPEEEMLSVTIKKGVIRQKDLLSDSSKKDSSNLDKSAYKLVQPGDIAYNKMRAWQGAIGVSNFRGIVSPAYIVVRPRGKNNPRYFHYLMRTPLFTKEAERWSYGITSDQWSLRSEHFKMIYSPLPPLEEQNAIVRFLDYTDRRIKRYIRAKQKLIKLLEEEKQAIIHQAVTRGLNPEVPLKPSGVEWMGDIPEHWKIERIKSKLFNINNQTSNRLPNEIYIALENVESWTGKLINNGFEVSFESQVKRFLEGDLLFGRLRPYLAKAIIPKSGGVCVGEFLVLRPKSPNLSIRFVEYLLRWNIFIDEINSYTYGAKMPRISWEIFGNIPIQIPELSEQIDIVNYLDIEIKKIEINKENSLLEISLLQEYHTRLIADVVTGKLDVREATAHLPEYLEEEEIDIEEVETEEDDELEEALEP